MTARGLRPPVWLPVHLRPLWETTPFQGLRAVLAGEADDASYRCQFALACMIRNRVRAPWWWGTTFQRVIVQPHQFTSLWDDWHARHEAVMLALIDPRSYPISADAAFDAITDRPDTTGGALYGFTLAGGRPAWAQHLQRTALVDRYEFCTYGDS